MQQMGRWCQNKKKKEGRQTEASEKKKQQRGETRPETGDEETTSHANHTREGKKRTKNEPGGGGHIKGINSGERHQDWDAHLHTCHFTKIKSALEEPLDSNGGAAAAASPAWREFVKTERRRPRRGGQDNQPENTTTAVSTCTGCVSVECAMFFCERIESFVQKHIELPSFKRGEWFVFHPKELKNK